MTQHAFYFYPSTMRMVNVDDNPDYNKAIKNVRRMVLISAWPDRFTGEVQDSLQQELMEQEGFEVLMEMDNSDMQFVLMGQEGGEQTVAFLHSEKMNGIAYVLGTVDLLAINDLIQKMRTSDDTGDESIAGLKMLWNLAVKEQTDARIRQEERKRWKEFKAREKARRDSI